MIVLGGETSFIASNSEIERLVRHNTCIPPVLGARVSERVVADGGGCIKNIRNEAF